MQPRMGVSPSSTFLAPSLPPSPPRPSPLPHSSSLPPSLPPEASNEEAATIFVQGL